MAARAPPPGGTVADGGENISVVVRLRPRSRAEVEGKDGKVVLALPREAEVKVKPGTPAEKRFTFDKVFDDAPQAALFDAVVAPVVDQAVAGYSCTVFAYGQTGTGKTYTMEGAKREDGSLMPDAESAGIVTRAVRRIFAALAAGRAEWTVKISFLEIYNERLDDLLAADSPTASAADGGERLKIVEAGDRATSKSDRDPTMRGMVKVVGLEEVDVRTPDEVFGWVAKGIAKRATAETLMNAHSSRSHCVFTVTVTTTTLGADGTDEVKIGKLNLVDLAGSESVGRSGAKDARAREAGNINQSLLTLGRVITALVDKLPHVPYRDSKLTRLLQDSLGGRTKTCIIATLSPVASSLEETLSTLEYANRAKNIKNKPEQTRKVAHGRYISQVSTEMASLKTKYALQVAQAGGEWITTQEKEGMLMEISELSVKVNELLAQHDEDEEKLEQWKLELSELRGALEAMTDKCAATESALASTQGVLASTQAALAGERGAHAETRVLVRAGAATEAALSQQAGQLLSTLRSSATDVAQLHGKVERATGTLAANAAAGRHFAAGAAERLAGLEAQAGAFHAEHARAVGALREEMAAMAHAHAGSAAALGGTVAQLRALAGGYMHSVGQSAGVLGAEAARACSCGAAHATAARDATVAAAHAGGGALTGLLDELAATLASQSEAMAAWAAASLRTLEDAAASLASHSAAHTAALASVQAELVERGLGGVDAALARHETALVAHQTSTSAALSDGADQLLAEVGSLVAAFVAGHAASSGAGVDALRSGAAAARGALARTRADTAARLTAATDDASAWAGRLTSSLTAGRGAVSRAHAAAAAHGARASACVAGPARDGVASIVAAVAQGAQAGAATAVADWEATAAAVAVHVSLERSRALTTGDAAARECDALADGVGAAAGAVAAAVATADAAAGGVAACGDQLAESLGVWVDAESRAASTFFGATLRTDAPTGATPSKAATVYHAPTALAASLPADAILGRYRAAVAAGVARTPERDARAFGKPLPPTAPLPMALGVIGTASSCAADDGLDGGADCSSEPPTSGGAGVASGSRLSTAAKLELLVRRASALPAGSSSSSSSSSCSSGGGLSTLAQAPQLVGGGLAPSSSALAGSSSAPPLPRQFSAPSLLGAAGSAATAPPAAAAVVPQLQLRREGSTAGAGGSVVFCDHQDDGEAAHAIMGGEASSGGLDALGGSCAVAGATLEQSLEESSAAPPSPVAKAVVGRPAAVAAAAAPTAPPPLRSAPTTTTSTTPGRSRSRSRGPLPPAAAPSSSSLPLVPAPLHAASSSTRGLHAASSSSTAAINALAQPKGGPHLLPARGRAGHVAAGSAGGDGLAVGGHSSSGSSRAGSVGPSSTAAVHAKQQQQQQPGSCENAQPPGLATGKPALPRPSMSLSSNVGPGASAGRRLALARPAGAAAK